MSPRRDLCAWLPPYSEDKIFKILKGGRFHRILVSRNQWGQAFMALVCDGRVGGFKRLRRRDLVVLLSLVVYTLDSEGS